MQGKGLGASARRALKEVGAMKAFLAIFVMLAIGAAGCSQQPPKPRVVTPQLPLPNYDQQTSNGLTVTVEAARRNFYPGDFAVVSVRMLNETGRVLNFNTSNESMVRLGLYRQTGLGWQKISQYPQRLLNIDQPYSIAPGEERIFTIPFEMSGGLPRSQNLRLMAEVPGFPQAKPFVTVWLFPQDVP